MCHIGKSQGHKNTHWVVKSSNDYFFPIYDTFILEEKNCIVISSTHNNYKFCCSKNTPNTIFGIATILRTKNLGQKKLQNIAIGVIIFFYFLFFLFNSKVLNQPSIGWMMKNSLHPIISLKKFQEKLSHISIERRYNEYRNQ